MFESPVDGATGVPYTRRSADGPLSSSRFCGIILLTLAPGRQLAAKTGNGPLPQVAQENVGGLDMIRCL
jgi:hypothetical protein